MFVFHELIVKCNEFVLLQSQIMSWKPLCVYLLHLRSDQRLGIDGNIVNSGPIGLSADPEPVGVLFTRTRGVLPNLSNVMLFPEISRAGPEASLKFQIPSASDPPYA